MYQVNPTPDPPTITTTSGGTGVMTDSTIYVGDFPPKELSNHGVCPSCGYCPTCGRLDAAPSPPVPYYPWYPPSPWLSPWITYTGSGGSKLTGNVAEPW